METKTVKLYSLDYSNARTYLMAALFIAGNMHCPSFSTLYRKAVSHGCPSISSP